MANFLLKKSYRLSTLAKVDYDPLWGSKGVFTTIRVCGEKPKYIFIKEHLAQLNKSLKKFSSKAFVKDFENIIFQKII